MSTLISPDPGLSSISGLCGSQRRTVPADRQPFLGNVRIPNPASGSWSCAFLSHSFQPWSYGGLEYLQGDLPGPARTREALSLDLQEQKDLNESSDGRGSFTAAAN